MTSEAGVTENFKPSYKPGAMLHTFFFPCHWGCSHETTPTLAVVPCEPYTTVTISGNDNGAVLLFPAQLVQLVSGLVDASFSNNCLWAGKKTNAHKQMACATKCFALQRHGEPPYCAPMCTMAATSGEREETNDAGYWSTGRKKVVFLLRQNPSRKQLCCKTVLCASATY